MGLFGVVAGRDDERRATSAGTTVSAEASLVRLERKVDVLLRTLGIEPGEHHPGLRIAVLEAKIDRALAAQGGGTSGVGALPYGAGSGPSWMAEVEAEIRAERLINAIKIYRDYTGQGLRESKEAVDALCADLRRRGEVRW